MADDLVGGWLKLPEPQDPKLVGGWLRLPSRREHFDKGAGIPGPGKKFKNGLERMEYLKQKAERADGS